MNEWMNEYGWMNEWMKKELNGINPSAAEMFSLIFHSFKAEIANTISSLKWRKLLQSTKNRHLLNELFDLLSIIPQTILI